MKSNIKNLINDSNRVEKKYIINYIGTLMSESFLNHFLNTKGSKLYSKSLNYVHLNSRFINTYLNKTLERIQFGC